MQLLCTIATIARRARDVYCCYYAFARGVCVEREMRIKTILAVAAAVIVLQFANYHGINSDVMILEFSRNICFLEFFIKLFLFF